MNTTKPPAIIKMFNLWMSNYSTFDWFMIIDDDSYLYLDTLLDYLTYHNKNDSLMIGDFLNWTENHPSYYTYDYSKWIGGGPGIVFTKKCIINYLYIINNYNPSDTWNHDYWLNALFQSKGKKLIKRIHCCGFYQYGTKAMKITDKKLLISVHLNHDMKLLDYFHKI